MRKDPWGKGFDEKKAAKEKRRQIEAANKMLIPAPKKTIKSMGLLSFDPSGTFRFAGGRWLKLYEVTGSIDEAVATAQMLKSRMRISIKYVPEKGDEVSKKAYISLMTSGEIYEDVRLLFKKDEEALQEMIGVRPLAVDEAIEVILSQLGTDRSFSYASFVRARRDLLKEISPVILGQRDHFQIEGTFGMSLFVKEYPIDTKEEAFSMLTKLGCPVFITFDLVSINASDKEDYIRTLERRYARALSAEKINDFINISCQISFLCDSLDALKIIAKTTGTIFSRAGYVIAPMYSRQEESFLSQISLGLTDLKVLRNKDVDQVADLFRREYGSNKDKI